MNKKLLITLIVVLLIGGVFIVVRKCRKEKIAVTSESCFAIENGKIIKYDTICGKEINIPSKINGQAVKEIGSNVFSNKEITKVVIPEGVEVIGSNAFRNNNIEYLSLPSTLKEIKLHAFENNKLTRLGIPDSVTSIGYAAFNNNLVKSKDEAFIYTRSVKDGKVEIDKEVLVSYAGADKDITIPSTVTTLHLNAFDDCGLTSIKLNDGLERIYTNALSNNKLTKIVIPSSVTVLGENALLGNPLEEIIVKGKTDVDTLEAFANDEALKILIKYE